MKTTPRVALLVVADFAEAARMARCAAGDAAAPDPQLLTSVEEAQGWLDGALRGRAPVAAFLEEPVLAALLHPAASANLGDEEFGEALRHELNNPLTGILGNAELLLSRRTELTPGAAARIESIADQALRLREAIRRLSLKFTKDSAAVKAGW